MFHWLIIKKVPVTCQSRMHKVPQNHCNGGGAKKHLKVKLVHFKVVL